MKYGHDDEPKARDMYLIYFQKYHHNNATIQKTGFYMNVQVYTYALSKIC